ncbi:MAG: LytTR family DNA-binding domain-containing protein [Sedimentitalea sp.]
MWHFILETKREALTRTNISVWALFSCLVAIAGPFGTYEALSFPVRLVYWPLVIGASAIIGTAVYRFVALQLESDRIYLHSVLMVGAMTLVFTPMLWAMTHAFLPPEAGDTPTMFLLAGYVAAVSGVVCGIRHFLFGHKALVAPYKREEVPAPVTDVQPRLLRRLPQDFKAPILRLSVQDHFVEVVSSQTAHTVRMRFGDAIEEMEGCEGYCTHRSHWVAADAVAGVEREGGRVQLRLSNGDKVPVSRTYRTDLQAAGVI